MGGHQWIGSFRLDGYAAITFDCLHSVHVFTGRDVVADPEAIETHRAGFRRDEELAPGGVDYYSKLGGCQPLHP